METVLNKNHTEFITPLSSRGESILKHLSGINFLIHPEYVLDVYSYESILNELDRIIAEAKYMKKTFKRGYDRCEPTKTGSSFGFSLGRDDIKVHRILS